MVGSPGSRNTSDAMPPGNGVIAHLIREYRPGATGPVKLRSDTNSCSLMLATLVPATLAAATLVPATLVPATLAPATLAPAKEEVASELVISGWFWL